ncbi:MAG TPA: phenylacetate-CoA oxygenase subunit PaaC [Flavobacteriales bacterium]|nr:phenylacetate-CoA oxygenase subunit PaaC [Flavobacteriales bacterium]HRE97576.1 phenylacetate-CoA oxygenase subunit PaaC [Flavobacteriales bacterium]
MNQQEALYQYTLRLGDNALILGHRLSEWTSKAPLLEEDLALGNLALDLLGQANSLLEYAGKTEGKGRSQDDLAYKRAEREFLNNLLVELPNGDFGFTIVRQFLYSTFALFLYEELSKSKDEQIAAIAAKSLKEIKYHVRHSSDWMLRLGDGTEESHNRVQKSLNDIWMYTGELFEMNEVDAILIKAGIAADLNAIKQKWSSKIEEVLSQATLKRPQDAFMQTGSRKGIHTEYLGFILAEMQYLPRAYPTAKW